MSTPSVPSSASPAAGWYPDPAGEPQQRYWDGAAWTAHLAPLQAGDAAPTVPGDQADPESKSKISFFGARAKAEELLAQLTAVRAERDELQTTGDRARAEVAELRTQLDRLGALTVAELEKRKEALLRENEEQGTRLESDRIAALAELARQKEAAQAESRREIAELESAASQLRGEVAELRAGVVTTKEEALLQEAGIYEYRHPLDDAVAYQGEIKRLRDRIKTMARRDGGAVLAAVDWTVNGSQAQGRKMVRDFSKLMLRAYNAEADNLARGMKPYKLDSAIDRLTKVSATIEKLGATMDIRISREYHDLRVKELELAADYAEKVAEEKEREREERARLREEQKAQQEMARERERLDKERQHHLNALRALIAKGDEEAIARLREQLAEIDQKIEDVDYRAANIRAGYVYVISNVGSFGESIVKVGLTRRLEPMDRVRELGDASVPFRFDVHTIFFSEDAVGIEAELHRRLADRRVNQVNLRREFFYARPGEVKTHLLELKGELLEYAETPEALEYHQSEGARRVPTAPAS